MNLAGMNDQLDLEQRILDILTTRCSSRALDDEKDRICTARVVAAELVADSERAKEKAGDTVRCSDSKREDVQRAILFILQNDGPTLAQHLANQFPRVSVTQIDAWLAELYAGGWVAQVKLYATPSYVITAKGIRKLKEKT